MSQVRIVGLNETVGFFNTADKDISQAVAIIVQETANAVRDNAKARAPSNTGKLNFDLRVTDKTLDATRGDLAATVTYMGKKRAFYGKFVEFGTIKMPARPFLGPAWMAEKPRFLEKIKDAIERKTK